MTHTETAISAGRLPPPSAGYQLVTSFIRRFGTDAGRLAMHAAVPLTLSPELVHLLRVNFVPSAPPIAEADLLLSPLCRTLERDVFELEPAVRSFLLDRYPNEPGYGPERRRAVTRLLLAFSGHRSVRSGTPRARWRLGIERLAALAIVDPDVAARSLTRLVGDAARAGRLDELGVFVRLTSELSGPLADHNGLVSYAAAVDDLLAGRTERAQLWLDDLSAPLVVDDLELPSPANAAQYRFDADGAEWVEGQRAPTEAPGASDVPEPGARRTAVTDAMREADWVSLVASVVRETCTLWVGPDAVTVTVDDERVPVLESLARFVKDRLDPAYFYLDPSEPSFVFEAAVDAEDQFVVQSWVAEFFEDVEVDDDVLGVLAELPFPLVVSTVPGPGVGSAFRRVKPGTVSEFYDLTAAAQSKGWGETSAHAPMAYDLYGSLDQPSSLVLTDSAQLDHVIAVVAKSPPLPPRLQAELQDPDRSFLFLGSGLDRWRARLLLRGVARSTRRRYASFALEATGSFQDSVRSTYASQYKVRFVDQDLAGFVSELRARVDAESGTGFDVDSSLADAPFVFLSFASEDRQIAGQLSEQLRRNGIAVWLDRDELRGGDRWEDEIDQIIREVDHVVVLQSESLLAKEHSYVYREVDLALLRQQRFRPGTSFIIPVTIDDLERRLDRLDDFQSIDLSRDFDEGVAQLTRTIRRDIQRRKRER